MSVYGAVLGACALGASIALAAWTAPLNGPPTCTSGNPGCDAPINVSSTAQTKSGSLTVSTSTASTYCIGASCISAWPSSGGGGTIGGSGTGGYIPMLSNGTTLDNSPLRATASNGILYDNAPAGNWAMEINWPNTTASTYGILVANSTPGYSQFTNAT